MRPYIVQFATRRMVVPIDRAVIVVDTDGVIQLWNEAAAALLHIKGADAVGKPVDIIIPEFLREQHWAAFRSAMANGALRESRDSLVTPAQVGGEIRPLLASLSLVKDGAGEVVGAIGVLQSQTA